MLIVSSKAISFPLIRTCWKFVKKPQVDCYYRSFDSHGVRHFRDSIFNRWSGHYTCRCGRTTQWEKKVATLFWGCNCNYLFRQFRGMFVSFPPFFPHFPSVDMSLSEDYRVNRLAESLDLFEEISSSDYFSETGHLFLLFSFSSRSDFFMFFNKDDMFRRKVNSHQFSEHFSEYKGNFHDLSNFLSHHRRWIL